MSLSQKQLCKWLLDGDVSGGRGFNNMAKVLGALPAAARNLFETMSRSPTIRSLTYLLGKAVENIINSAALMTISKKHQGFPTPRSVSSGRSLSTKFQLCLSGLAS